VTRGNNIGFEFLNRSNGPGYVVNIINQRKIKGRYFDTIVLRTDSNAKRDIIVNVFGNIGDEPTIKPKENVSKEGAAASPVPVY
jgi:hypothetical protein